MDILITQPYKIIDGVYYGKKGLWYKNGKFWRYK